MELTEVQGARVHFFPPQFSKIPRFGRQEAQELENVQFWELVRSI